MSNQNAYFMLNIKKMDLGMDQFLNFAFLLKAMNAYRLITPLPVGSTFSIIYFNSRGFTCSFSSSATASKSSAEMNPLLYSSRILKTCSISYSVSY